VSRISFQELFRRFYGGFESLKIPYFAYGGVAVAVWGNPRETQDVDAVVAVADEAVPSLVKVLQSGGFSCESEAAKTFPIDGWLRLNLQGRHADISLGRTPFDRSAVARRH